MSCSARLPVYTLVIAVAFPGDRRVLGVLSVGAIALFGMYALSVVTTLSAERDEYLANIWVVDTAGGSPRRFTTGPGRDTAPRWSPDGTRLLTREPRQKSQLYVMPADGGEPVRPIASPTGDRAGLVADSSAWRLCRPWADGRSWTVREESTGQTGSPITTMKYNQ
jgi:Tol biopolymer transport system component